jgi:hypothetical protein
MYLKIPVFRESIAHKVKEWEVIFKDAITKYKEIVKVIEPEKKENTTVNKTGFEIEKINTGWIVKPVLIETRQKTPSKARNTHTDKTEVLKTILLYLLECDDYLNSTYEQLIEKWKPLIDEGIFDKNVIER